MAGFKSRIDVINKGILRAIRRAVSKQLQFISDYSNKTLTDPEVFIALEKIRAFVNGEFSP